MRTLIIALLIAIAISLGAALVYLMRSKDGDDKLRTAKALTWRIGLSIALFAIIAFFVVRQRL